MTPLWSVRKYKEGDKAGILELMNLEGNGEKRTCEHWSWEYGSNPLGNLIWVAEHDQQIVGHMALIPTNMKIGEKNILGSQAVDLIVHPKYRHQGMFLTIGRTATEEAGREGVDVTYGFPNEPAHSGHLKYGWFDICKIFLLLRICNAQNMVGFFEKYKIIKLLNRHKTSRKAVKSVLQITSAASSFFPRISDRIRKEPSLAEDIEIHAITSFNNIDSFWERVSKDFSIIVARDKKYLNWRYFERPDVKYTVLLAERNAKILGYVVLRSVNENKLNLGYIVDVLASPDSRLVIQALILRAVEHFKKEGVDAIACWMLKNNEFYKVLRYNRFVPFSSYPFIARLNSTGLSKEFVRNQKNWYVTIGDSDHI
jgi:GNAT superfamily N-acetyltransferase